jgi:hypothetical protein
MQVITQPFIAVTAGGMPRTLFQTALKMTDSQQKNGILWLMPLKAQFRQVVSLRETARLPCCRIPRREDL